ncbi:ABC transporter substrate-binding protein [Rhodococcus sp. C26F]
MYRSVNRHRNRRYTLIATVIGSALAASACSAEASSNEADGRAHIVGLIEVKGDSPNALDDYNVGAQIAVDEINAVGGILGEPLEYTRIPASVTDPQNARTAFLKAVDLNPSAIIGFPGGGSLEALTRDVDAAEIPMIHISSDGKLARGAEAGSEWLFSVNPDDTARARGAVELSKQLGADTIGIIATDETFGRTSTENTLAVAETSGIAVEGVRYVPPTATDLTGPILEFQNVDAVVSWTFPNVLALQMNQMLQNQIDVPVVTGNSGPLVSANDLAPREALENLYAVTPCAPKLGESVAGHNFAATYEEKQGTEPTASATQVYDAVHFLAQAMEEAGTTTDHEKIVEAMRTIEWQDGACASRYYSDEAQYLGHQMIAESFAGEGSIVAEYAVPDA